MKNYFLPLIIMGVLLNTTSCKNSGVKTSSDYEIPAEILELPEGVTLGLRAPEIVLPDSTGEEKSLSSLHGKLVLVDFWAAWCNPCREENPKLEKAYHKYKDKSFTKGEGFEIFSVSLDRNEKSWKMAIAEDKITWPYMLCDFEGARSQAAVDYGVQMIPSNFLLDQNGVVIATNLRGDMLEEKLKSLLPED